MKSRKSLYLMLFGFLILTTFLNQSASGTLYLGDMGSIPGYRNSYAIWNITEASNFQIKVAYGMGYLNDYAQPGDMLKMTILSESTFRGGYYYIYGGGEASKINPCWVGGIDYFNSSTCEWVSCNADPYQIGYFSSTYCFQPKTAFIINKKSCLLVCIIF